MGTEKASTIRSRTGFHLENIILDLFASGSGNLENLKSDRRIHFCNTSTRDYQKLPCISKPKSDCCINLDILFFIAYNINANGTQKRRVDIAPNSKTVDRGIILRRV